MGINVVSTVGKYEGYAFRLGAASGLMAASLAAGASIFSFANKTSARKVRILEVSISAAADATAFTAGSASFKFVVDRAITAYTTGGTQVAIAAGNNTNKLRTSQVTSQLQGAAGDIRVAATAALTNPTATTDTNAHGILTFGVPAVAGQLLLPDTTIYRANTGSYTLPLVLDQTEGFRIQATVPATGTWVFGVNVLWSEIDGGGGLRS